MELIQRNHTQSTPDFIPEQKAPPGHVAKGLSNFSLIKMGKNLLCRTFLNVGEGTRSLQTVIVLPSVNFVSPLVILSVSGYDAKTTVVTSGESVCL